MNSICGSGQKGNGRLVSVEKQNEKIQHKEEYNWCFHYRNPAAFVAELAILFMADWQIHK